MQGIIKIETKGQGEAPYTTLLVGGTGVGKSSILELIANALDGTGPDHYNVDNVDNTNERDCSHNQSQTNSARLYELTINNSIVVRVRASQRDEYM